MYDEPTKDFIKRLEDPEYTKLYGEEAAKVDFAITLTKARRSLNLSQKELASRLGISQPYIAKLEGGEANPTLGAIGRLLAAVNLRLVTGAAPLTPEPATSKMTIKVFSSGLHAAEDVAAIAWKDWSNATGGMSANPSVNPIYYEGVTV